MSGGGAKLARSFWLWAPLFVVLAAEFLLFDQIGAHRFTWVYARWNDQVQYLTEAYFGWEAIRVHGALSGLWQTLTSPCAQGTLHGFLANLVFLAAGGPSRSAALALNMLAFMAWQGLSAAAAWRRTGSAAFAWMAAALPLALAGPWNGDAGSAADFRLDHLALCAMGATLAAAFASDGLRSAGWASALGAAAGLTVLLRFLTTVYLAPILAILLIATRIGPDRVRRLRHGLLALAIAGALALPFLWHDRPYIWSYYGIGHFTGPEAALRDSHMDLGASLRWLVEALAKRHLGAAFGWVLAGGSAALAVGALRGRAGPLESARPAVAPCPQQGGPSGPALPSTSLQLALLGLLFAVVPALVLATHSQKSEIVVGISAPGFLAMVLAGWWWLASRCPRRWRMVCAAGVVTACAVSFTQRQLAQPFSPEFAAGARKVNALADAIFRRSRQAGLASPAVGVDYITDCLDAQAIRLICYERHQVMVPFFMTLPLGIVTEPAELLQSRLRLSDFFFLTEAGPPGNWPFDRDMRRLAPANRVWCEAHLRAAERFPLFGREMILYQRKEIPVD